LPPKPSAGASAKKLGLVAPAYQPVTARGQKLAELRAAGYSVDDLTVMQFQRDPFRLDTPARHRDGKWFAEQMVRFKPTGTIHLRGFHYLLCSTAMVQKSNGEIYRNNDIDWTWLMEIASKAARWLGYVSFDRIHDERNDEPEVWEPEDWSEDPPWPSLWCDGGGGIELPSATICYPRVDAGGTFAAQQPFRIILIGEKSSLRSVLAPVAARVHGELILPNGEMTNTLIHDMAKRAVVDGRPAVVLYFSDFDPSGWGMPVVVSRKLQALAFDE
jgi:hypothetical protein